MSQGFIERLSKCDRGERAALRSVLREELEFPPPAAIRVVDSFVADEHPKSWRRKFHYLVAALYASRYPNPEQSEVSGEIFGRVAARITKSSPNFEPSKTGSLEKRFLHLLDCEQDELAYPLQQWVSLLKAGSYDLDWAKLLQDIIWWNDRSKDEWARAYYRELNFTNLPQQPEYAEEET